MKENKVIFVPFTVFQLVSSIYYAQKLKSEKTTTLLIWQNYTNCNINVYDYSAFFDIILEIDDFYKRGLFRRQWEKCFYAGWFYYFSPIHRQLKKYKNDNVTLVCFSDSMIVTTRIINEVAGFDRHHIVVCEEGIKTYTIEYPEHGKAWIFDKMLGAKESNYIGENKRIDSFVVKKPDELPADKKKSRATVQQNDFFLDTSFMNCFSSGLNNYRIDSHKKTVLWLGQPLETDGISPESELRVLREIAQSLSDYNFVIKRHPRENQKKYDFLNESNVHVLDFGDSNWLPIEIIISKINPSTIISVYSSAGLNLLQYLPDAICLYIYPIFKMKPPKEFISIVESEQNAYVVDDLSRFRNGIIEERRSRIIHRKKVHNNDDDLNYFKSLLI